MLLASSAAKAIAISFLLTLIVFNCDWKPGVSLDAVFFRRHKSDVDFFTTFQRTLNLDEKPNTRVFRETR